MKKLYVSNKDESVRMFESNFMEFFTKVHFTVPLFLYIPVISYFLYLSFIHPELTLLTGLGYVALGILSWSTTEYFLHRYVFHFHPTSEWGKKIHFLFHGVHHDYPNDSNRLVMPPGVSIPLAFLFYFGFKTFMPLHFLYPFFAGFVLGYLFYDMLHYALHHVDLKGKMWIALKTHHLKHHFKDPDKGFGVSSPLWDIIVGSNFSSKLNEKKGVDKKTIESKTV